MSVEREGRQVWSTQYFHYPEIFTRITNAMAALQNRCAELLHYLIQDGWHSHETSKIDIHLKNRVPIEDNSYKANNRNDQLLPLTMLRIQPCDSHDLHEMTSLINIVSTIQTPHTLRDHCSLKQESEDEQLLPHPICVGPCCNRDVILTNSFGIMNLRNQECNGVP